MPDALQTSQPHHEVATLKAALAASGLDLDRLCAQIRAHRDEADRTGQIPTTFWQSDMVRALNLNLVPSQYGDVLGAIAHVTRDADGISGLRGRRARAGPARPRTCHAPVLALANERQQAAFFAGFHSDAPRCAFAITARLRVRRNSHADIGPQNRARLGAQWHQMFHHEWRTREHDHHVRNDQPQRGSLRHPAFRVEHDAPGFSVMRVEHMAGLRASQLAVLSYSDCEVPDDACLTHDDQAPLSDAFSGAQRSWDYFRPLLSAVMVGTCRRVRDELATYFESGSHPAEPRCDPGDVDVHLLDLDRHITTARLLCHHAAWLADHGHPSAMHASMAKAYAARVTAHVTRTALALVGLGGIAHCPSLEQCCRDAKAFDIMEGTGDMQRLMIARAAQRAPQLPWNPLQTSLHIRSPCRVHDLTFPSYRRRS